MGAKEHIQVKIANSMAYLGVFFCMKHHQANKKIQIVLVFRKIVDVLATPYSPVKVIDNMLVQSGLETW